MSCSAQRIVRTLATALLVCPLAVAKDSPLAERYPRAKAALQLVHDSPLLEQILSDPEFFEKLDGDPLFAQQVRDKLALQAYRSFGPVPSVRVRVFRGTPADWPAIVLEYQTKFDDLSNWGSGPFKSGSCVFVGGGRDAPGSRTVYGGSEDPAVRARWHELMAERQAMPSNRRREKDPEISAWLRTVMPSMPLDEVRADIEAKIATLVSAFKPYGAHVLDQSNYGQFGAKITDNLYIHIRDCAAGGGDDGGYTRRTPYFWVTISAGPRPLPEDYLPAFPGAEGFGAMTTGGRGGKVVYVTTLAPTGPGSLAEALNTKGPRIVLFNVSGQIDLPDETWIREPNLTLIGHTAPGEGVEVHGRLCMAADNVIMRGMRWRLRPPQAMDGMDTEGDLRNIIFDHCSFAYGSDELIRFIGDGATFVNGTIQYCVVGPGTGGLGSHPYGPEMGGVVSFHHNVLYNAFSRSPEVDCDLLDFRNNILYNLRSGHSRRLSSRLNYVDNLVILNPHTDIRYSFRSADNNYCEGNVYVSGSRTREFVPSRSTYVKEPYRVMPVTTYAPAELEDRLLSTVGASVPVRDATDAHWIEGLKNRTGKPVFWQDRVGRWRSYNVGSNELDNYEVLPLAQFPAPVAAGAEPIVDSDSDGMPDTWETANGLDPHDPTDAQIDSDNDGYPNLEEFVNRTDPRQYVDYRQPANNVDSVFKR
jgi:pectate lyase